MIVSLLDCYFASKAEGESVDQNPDMFFLKDPQGFEIAHVAGVADAKKSFLCTKDGNVTREIHSLAVRQHNQTKLFVPKPCQQQRSHGRTASLHTGITLPAVSVSATQLLMHHTT